MRARRLLLSALAATAAITTPAGAAEPINAWVCEPTIGCVFVDADAGGENTEIAVGVSRAECVALDELGEAGCGTSAGAATTTPGGDPVTASCVRSGAGLKVAIYARSHGGRTARSVSVHCAAITARYNYGSIAVRRPGPHATGTATVPATGGEKLCYRYEVTWNDYTTSSYSMFSLPACQVDEW